MAAALLLGQIAVPVDAREPVVTRHRTTIGGWRLEIARYGFSGEIVCRLREAHGRAVYRGGAIGFRVARGRDVGAAMYRIDGAESRSWRDDLPELLALGTPMETGPMTAPSDGFVYIPWRRLAQANGVAIQAEPGRRPRVFRLGGVHGLRALAAARGCAPDARFVR